MPFYNIGFSVLEDCRKESRNIFIDYLMCSLVRFFSFKMFRQLVFKVVKFKWVQYQHGYLRVISYFGLDHLPLLPKKLSIYDNIIIFMNIVYKNSNVEFKKHVNIKISRVKDSFIKVMRELIEDLKKKK